MGGSKTKDPKPATKPSWEDYWATVGNENYLYARELIELSPDVRAHFAHFIDWHDSPALVDDPDDPPYSMNDPEGWVWRDVDLDWAAAAKSADEWAASSTQVRLLALVLSLVQPDREYDSHEDRFTGTRTINVQDLGSMGSWQGEVAEIMARFIGGSPPARQLRI